MTSESLKGKRLVGLFLLGVVLFNYPILSLFNIPVLKFGFPVFYLYIFSIWAALVIFIILATRSKTVVSDFDSEG